jgi:hypothetical protein
MPLELITVANIPPATQSTKYTAIGNSPGISAIKGARTVTNLAIKLQAAIADPCSSSVGNIDWYP